jgi:hypothetical protein
MRSVCEKTFTHFLFPLSVKYILKMSLPIAYPYEAKWNFWNNVLAELVYTPVKDRCYNSKGNKTKATEAFLSKHCSSISPSFSEYKVSTLVDHFNIIVALSVELAKEYEINAECQFSAQSPEYKERIKFDFIRNETEDTTSTWLNDDFYKNAVLFPSISQKAGPDMLKTLFKFNQKQKQAMEKPNDVDGRVIVRNESRLLLLMIHVGFGELLAPLETLSGKATVVQGERAKAATEQKQKDDLTEDFANHFAVDDDDEVDELGNINLFGGKKRKKNDAALGAAEKKLRKQKNKEAAQLAAQKTIQADPIDALLKIMTDPVEIERREKREDLRHNQGQRQQFQMFQALLMANNNQQQISSSSSSAMNTSNASAVYSPSPVWNFSSPSSQQVSLPKCVCGKQIEQTHTFCHGCGRRNAAS